MNKREALAGPVLDYTWLPEEAGSKALRSAMQTLSTGRIQILWSVQRELIVQRDL